MKISLNLTDFVNFFWVKMLTTLLSIFSSGSCFPSLWLEQWAVYAGKLSWIFKVVSSWSTIMLVQTQFDSFLNVAIWMSQIKRLKIQSLSMEITTRKFPGKTHHTYNITKTRLGWSIKYLSWCFHPNFCCQENIFCGYCAY